MITGKDNILKWFAKSGEPGWKIYHYGKSDASATVAQCPQGLDHNQAYNELSDALTILSGRYNIATCNSDGKRSPRNDWKEEFEVSKEDRSVAASVGAVAPVITGVAPDEVSKQIQAALHQYKTDEELKTLRAKVAELEKENRELEKATSDPFNQIAGILVPMLPGLLGKAQTQVAGVPPGGNVSYNHVQQHAETNDSSNDETERLGRVVAVLQNATPEWLELLEKIAAKVQADPGFINMAKYL